MYEISIHQYVAKPQLIYSVKIRQIVVAKKRERKDKRIDYLKKLFDNHEVSWIEQLPEITQEIIATIGYNCQTQKRSQDWKPFSLEIMTEGLQQVIPGLKIKTIDTIEAINRGARLGIIQIAIDIRALSPLKVNYEKVFDLNVWMAGKSYPLGNDQEKDENFQKYLKEKAKNRKGTGTPHHVEPWIIAQWKLMHSDHLILPETRFQYYLKLNLEWKAPCIKEVR